MIEFTSNHHGIRLLEKFCEYAVAKGMGKCVKDSRPPAGQDMWNKDTLGRQQQVNPVDENNCDEARLKGEKFGVAVYNQYYLRVSRGFLTIPHVAEIRFWYNEHNKLAGLKISEESLIAILQTTTVTKFLRDLDVSLGGRKDGENKMDKVANVLTKAMVKMDPSIRVPFTAKQEGKYRFKR